MKLRGCWLQGCTAPPTEVWPAVAYLPLTCEYIDHDSRPKPIMSGNTGPSSCFEPPRSPLDFEYRPPLPASPTLNVRGLSRFLRPRVYAGAVPVVRVSASFLGERLHSPTPPLSPPLQKPVCVLWVVAGSVQHVVSITLQQSIFSCRIAVRAWVDVVSASCSWQFGVSFVS